MGQSKHHTSPRQEAREYIAEKAVELSAMASVYKFDFLKELLDLVIYEADPKALDIERLREVAAEMRKHIA